MSDLELQAREDYKTLKNIIQNHKGTLGDLYEKLNGFDIHKKLFFSVNFGTISALVYYDFQTEKIGLCDEVDVWDESEIVIKNCVMEG